jgi:hypothetical protein
MRPHSALRARRVALAASGAVLVALCLFSQASETMAGFTARVTNSANRAGTAPYFTCAGAYTADAANALFAYRLDDSGTSTAPYPGSALYEAESATLSGGAIAVNDHTGYSGTGFVAGYTDANRGARTVFTVSAPVTDTHAIAVRYANAGGTAKTLTLQVDSTAAQQISLPPMVSWDDWSTVYVSAPLTAGSHTVALTFGPNDTGNVNLDYLQVSPRSAVAVRDTFSGTAGTTLQSRSADVGGSWVRRDISGLGDDDAVFTPSGRIRKSNASTYAALYTSSTAPTSADYTVSADIATVSSVPEDRVGVVGRMDPANPNGTFYMARYEQAGAAYVLFRVVNDSWTYLGEWGAPVTANSTHRLSLDMNGTTIRMLVDGTQRLSVTDGGITAAGLAGVAMGFAYTTFPTSTTITDTAGMHLDNFETTYRSVTTGATATDFSPRKSNGTYQGARATGAPPTRAGCPRDGGAAYVLDGSTSYVTNPSVWTGTSVFTAEVWFRTTVAGGRLIGFGDRATGPSIVFDRMIYMTDDGRLVFGVHPDTMHTITSRAGVNYADGAWHHAAATLSPAGMVLYVDGAVVARDTATTTAQGITGYWRIGYDSVFGWPSAPSNPSFTGSMRFAAVYTVALSGEQIARHYTAGR